MENFNNEDDNIRPSGRGDKKEYRRYNKSNNNNRIKERNGGRFIRGDIIRKTPINRGNKRAII